VGARAAAGGTAKKEKGDIVLRTICFAMGMSLLSVIEKVASTKQCSVSRVRAQQRGALQKKKRGGHC